MLPSPEAVATTALFRHKVSIAAAELLGQNRKPQTVKRFMNSSCAA